MYRSTARRVAAYTVAEVPRGVSGRTAIRSAVPSGAATESSTIAATTWSDCGHVSSKWIAPWPPVVPASVETNTRPRSRVDPASSCASSSITPVLESLSSAPLPTPSRCAITAITCGLVPRWKPITLCSATAPRPGSCAAKVSSSTV